MSLDIIFISYDEPNADRNFSILQQYRPYAKRVHGVKGIKEAHIAAAKQSMTSSFFVVDGDVEVLPTCDEVFDYVPPLWDKQYVHIWSSRNPITNDIYGNGGIKLFSKKMFLDINNDLYVDFSTSCGAGIKIMETSIDCAITRFNSTAYHAWRGAFRECAKLTLSSRKNPSVETIERLGKWFSVNDTNNEQFADDVMSGVVCGTVFGRDHDDITMINDESWVHTMYQKFNKAKELYEKG